MPKEIHEHIIIGTNKFFRQEDGTYSKTKPDNSNADPSPDLEQNNCNEPVGEKKTPRFTSQVRITIHSIRRRLADSDGISGKATIDGLVKAGILADDTTKEVKGVYFTQEKCAQDKIEKTIITLNTT